MKQQFPRPKLFVSRCLGFDACRYNGLKLLDESVERLKTHADIITACPEVAIGLGVPRNPIRIVQEKGQRLLYQPADEKEYSGPMSRWVAEYLDALDPPDGFILKSRSPSCGPWGVKMYVGVENPSSSEKTGGFFGGEVVKRYPGYPVEEEGRLKNFTLREHFLTYLYTIAAWREVVARPGAGAKDLVRFHTVNKLLFLAYNQSGMRRLGKLVSRAGEDDFAEILSAYREGLGEIFAKPPKFNNMINAFQHAFGGLSEGLSSTERAFFINSLEEYRDERIPGSTIIHLLMGWAIRFGNEYLQEQTLMAPFPRELVEISDSGKGRDR
jgi:uncharacterized protein YbgA (DUF1722 family)/uncharacterized protein YbbK (DUF523 family)